MQDLEKRVVAIEERNTKVEADKAWETSLSRKLVIAIFTYIVVGIYLGVIGVSNQWVNAIVPAVGFLLSTLTLPFLKVLWIKFFWNKD